MRRDQRTYGSMNVSKTNIGQRRKCAVKVLVGGLTERDSCFEGSNALVWFVYGGFMWTIRLGWRREGGGGGVDADVYVLNCKEECGVNEFDLGKDDDTDGVAV